MEGQGEIFSPSFAWFWVQTLVGDISPRGRVRQTCVDQKYTVWWVEVTCCRKKISTFG